MREALYPVGQASLLVRRGIFGTKNEKSFGFIFVLILISHFSPESSSGLHSPASAQASAGTQLSTLTLKETKLANIPENYQTLQILFSANGQKVVYKAIKQGRHFVVVNDKAGKFYEAINDLIVFSPDRKKVAYDGKSFAYGARIGRELWWKAEAVE